ncbi:ferritin-like domain-containing protein [Leeuwenhoekiella sp. A16]|uniref:YciE/YciF ferroxidase family protein n=1 Tax=unclassified Leeuwenhoekiella TaxID=2615029 RepID=UPI003A80158E
MKIMLDLLEKQLQNLYNSELLILDALAEMLDYVTDTKLKEHIKNFAIETQEQKVRLEDIGELLHLKIAIKDGNIIRGLLMDTHELYSDFSKGFLMDVGIISKILQITHFQISGYETALLYIKNLDISEVQEKLEKTLEEAYEGDENYQNYAKTLLLTKNNKP